MSEPWLLPRQEIAQLGEDYLRSHPVPDPRERDDIILRAQHRKDVEWLKAHGHYCEEDYEPDQVIVFGIPIEDWEQFCKNEEETRECPS